jgi:Skp family chaperone for outer membrane proteins
MKHPFSILALAFLFVGAGSTMAQTKIATIDLKKIVDNYWKKDEAYATLKETGADMEKELKTMADDLKKLDSSYQQLIEAAADPAISTEEKEKRKKQADEKRQDILKKREEATTYQNNAELQLREKKNNVDSRLLSEIRNVIAANAKTGGYTLVLNAGAEAAVMYASSDNDITEQVIKELNKGRLSHDSGADTPSDDKKKKK